MTGISRNTSIFLLCSLLLLVPAPSWGQDITIKYANGWERDGLYLVDISIELELDEKIINALKHGVSLSFDVELQIRRQRRWVWDKLIEEARLKYELYHHPLSDDYLITNLNDGGREQFQTLDEALKYLGSIRNFPITVARKITGDKNYIGLIKAELNIEELPPPLQPISYVSSDWHLKSQWYEWIIR